MKPSNSTAKEVFVIKESRSFQNAIKIIKQILDAEYSLINLKTILMSLIYSMVKHKNSVSELLHKYEKTFDRILRKHTGSDHTVVLKENNKFCHTKSFPIQKTQAKLSRMKLID